MRNARAILIATLLLGARVVLWPALVGAHQGPPYPLIVDKDIGPCLVSVWADPDVGTGTFFIMLDPHQKGGAFPAQTAVRIAVQPVTGRLDEVRYDAVRDDIRGRVQYKAEAQFDSEERWRVRILVHTSEGDGETATEVEVTPPGYGRWDLLLYALPFIAVGSLWLRATLRGRGRKEKLLSKEA